MKFGDTLPQRSVPKWAGYNVNYNQLKHLIKVRTSRGSSIPLSIPAAGISRWHDLDTELHRIIAVEYENVALFLRSKQGEIERRLSYLEKQVASTKKAINQGALDRPIVHARKYQKLVRDADGIGDEIENLSRFAGVQKTAFRKILKKYRKWTGSTGLQHRLDLEVFSSGALQVDYAQYLQRLSEQSAIISSELAGPMLSSPRFQRTSLTNTSSEGVNRSNAKAIADLCSKGSLQFDAAMSCVPYGEAGGSTYFWIHPDNLDEAEALLLRHMRRLEPSSPKAREPSSGNAVARGVRNYHVIFNDNIQRFTQDTSLNKPSRVALAVRWTFDNDAVVTFSSLAPHANSTDTVKIRRKELGKLLRRTTETSRVHAENKLREYLSEHRDVKALAELHSNRTRYVGLNNGNEIGSWATLDSSVITAPVNLDLIGEVETEVEAAEAFPHSILHVRWEFSRLPEVARLFQTSHLTEPVPGFSLEQAAIHTVITDLEQPQWRQMLETDIRKVPSTLRKKDGARKRSEDLTTVPVSSGPSSTDGPSDSVFSMAAEPSSATSIDDSPNFSQREKPLTTSPRSKKKLRIATPPASELPPRRYWNEFDDGDSDVNPEEAYAIYLDPNESSFPGADSISHAFGAIYSSLSKGSKQMVAWLPIKSRRKASTAAERSPLLADSPHASPDLESSGSDTDEMIISTHEHHCKQPRRFRPGQPLSRRQKALEKTLLQFYTGLILLAYLLLFMAAILYTTGRKKKVLEVDAGVVAGVAAAESCAGISIVLICMRRRPLGPVHWGLMAVNVIAIVMVGVAELTIMFMGRA